MRWDDLPESRQRRGSSRRGRRLRRGGGGFGLPIGGGGLGIGTIVVLGLIGWALGIDPRLLIGGAEILTGAQPAAASQRRSRAARRTGSPTDDIGQLRQPRARQHRGEWKDIFSKDGRSYRAPVLVIYSRRDRSPVRRRGAERDGAVLLPGRPEGLSRHLVLRRDRDALPRLRRRQQGVPVLAGLCDRARGRPSRAEPARHPAEGAAAAARRRQQGRGQPHPGAGSSCRPIASPASGRTRNASLRRQGKPRSSSRATSKPRCRPPPRSATTRCRGSAQGYVVPDSFTHGTSEQRQRWFMTGFQDGLAWRACNTFAAARSSSAIAMPGIDAEQAIRPAQDRGADGVRHPRARRRQVRRDARRAHREGRARARRARHRHRRRREDPRAGEGVDRRSRRSTWSSPPAAPASPAATSRRRRSSRCSRSAWTASRRCS